MMMSRLGWIVMIRRLLFLTLAFIGLTACGSTPETRSSEMVQAQEADKEARRALRDGQLLRAQRGFNKVLVLQQSQDNVSGSATTMVNLATVAHQLKEHDAALTWLDRIVMENPNIYPVELQLIAAFRKSVMLADLSRIGEADSSLKIAERLCDKSCTQKLGLDVLRARLLLLNGNIKDALSLAQTVSSNSAAGMSEQANALRIAATSEEKLARYEEAFQHFEAALETDKALGFSERIAADLNGMARVAKQLGNEREAEEYSKRALIVQESLRQIDSSSRK